MLNLQSLQVGRLTYCCLYVYTACNEELELLASIIITAIKINAKKTIY